MAIFPKVGGKNCLDPSEALNWSEVHHTPQNFWGRANSYSCPLGADPGSAWLLLLRSDLDDLDANDFHELKWVDGSRALTIPQLTIVRSATINLAKAGDKKAAHLVELQDKRKILRLSSINAQYNVRIPAPTTAAAPGIYYDESLNASAAWTWQTLVTDIWGKLPSTAGTAPTLPYTPNGTPEGWRFIGVSAWDALHEVLAKVDCTTSYDPIANTFDYVRLGTTQTGLAAAVSLLSNRLMYDYDPGDDYQQSSMPETVRVFFHRRELYHGAEKDTVDTGNWEMSPVVSKDYATGITGVQAGTVLAVWDDLPATFNTAGTNTNSGALQTRANEIGANIANTINTNGSRRMYSGLVTSTTVLPGAEVSEIIWRDYGDEHGLVTEIVQRQRKERAGSGRQSERIATPDFARATHPLFPRLGQPVQVDDGASSTGATLTANGDGLFPGFVLRWTGAWETLEACWIRPADLVGSSEAAVADLRQKDRFTGRLSGSQSSGGDLRPVYVVRAGEAGGADLFSVSADNGSDVMIDSGDTLDFDASDQTFGSAGSAEANATQSLWGIVNEVEGGDSTIKRVKFAVDKSVQQSVTLSGVATSGDPNVRVRQGTRNSMTYVASTTSPVTLTGDDTAGDVEFGPNDPFHTVEGDTGSENLNFQDTLEFNVSGEGSFAVTKPLQTLVTLTIDDQLPIGSVIMGVKAPIFSGDKYYLDDGTGAANTKWALMDGNSNVGAGLSGITMAENSGSPEEWFVRALGGTGAADDTKYGRKTSAGTSDDDELTIAVVDHPDHRHQMTTDVCDFDHVGTDPQQYEFGSANPISGTQIAHDSTSPITLDHTMSLTNNQSTSTDKVEMFPPHKKLHFYEKIA